jgi:hypothetical protein
VVAAPGLPPPSSILLPLTASASGCMRSRWSAIPFPVEAVYVNDRGVRCLAVRMGADQIAVGAHTVNLGVHACMVL